MGVKTFPLHNQSLALESLKDQLCFLVTIILGGDSLIHKTKTVKKNQLNRIKVLKKISVRFGFGFRNLKPEKPQPNRTEPVQLRGTINRKKNRSYS
jgi:hypothetical protein